MQLPKQVSFRLATLEEVTLQPNEDGGKAVLVISAPLNPNLAKSLGRREMLYDEKGLSREFTGSIGLTGDAVVDYRAQIQASGMADTFYSPEKIRGFKVVRGSTESDKSDVQLRLEFRMHVTGRQDIDSAVAFFNATNKDCFDVFLESRQIEMFPAEEEPTAPQSKSKNRKSKAESAALASKRSMETATTQ